MKRILIIFNLLLAAAVLGAAWWYMWRPLAQTSGSVSMPVSKPVKVVRDALGVPHISAQSIEDAIAVQGYVTAQDRLFQMDALRRLAAGELAEITGPAGLEADQEARKLRLRRLAAELAATLRPEDRAAMAAYARGVNHFIQENRGRLPVEFALLGYDPRFWTVQDCVLTGLQMFRSLTNSWKDEIAKQQLLSKGDKAKVDYLYPSRTGGEVQPGSNAWAISGKLTASGKPLLANDTHLEWSFPSAWYMVHLAAPGLNVTGFSLPGIPAVLIGHNDRIAWGITNLQYDVQDLYLEEFDSASGRYRYRDGAETARLERETIRIRGHQPIEVKVWVTRHGPILTQERGPALALRWVAAEAGGFHFPFLDIDRAANWGEFRKAVESMPGPGSNFLYADADGNIGYQVAGKLPIRKNYDGDLPAAGPPGASEWEGFLPFDELPSSYNPPSGMLVSSNQNPFPGNYPHRIHGNFASHYRGRQVEARLKSKSGWKAEEMLLIQTDVYSAFSRFLAQQVVRAWQGRGKGNPALAGPGDVLEKWDGQMHGDSPAALLVTLIYQHLRKAVAERASPGQGATYDLQMAPAVLERLLTQRPKEWFNDFDAVLMQAFSDAVAEGRGSQADVSKWRYGAYTSFTLVHPVLSRIPVVNSLPWLPAYFRVGPVPMHGASTTVKQTTRRLGPSMRFVADLSNWENSLANITIGQSGQPMSSHFKDQWESYYAGRSFPMRFGKVDAESTLDIRPLP